MEPNIIKVSVRRTTETREYHVTDQGFCYSSFLETPVTNTVYIWEGKLHEQRDKFLGEGSFVGNDSMNSKASLDDLAQNLALNLVLHPSTQHTQSGIPAYGVRYQVGWSRVENGDSSIVTEPLAPDEQMVFSAILERTLKQLVITEIQ